MELIVVLIKFHFDEHGPWLWFTNISPEDSCWSLARSSVTIYRALGCLIMNEAASPADLKALASLLLISTQNSSSNFIQKSFLINESNPNSAKECSGATVGGTLLIDFITLSTRVVTSSAARKVPGTLENPLRPTILIPLVSIISPTSALSVLTYACFFRSWSKLQSIISCVPQK